jgi:hypothetical protein
VTTIYTFANLADQDQGAGTDLRPFGQFYAPTSVATQCYNALFGKGHYDGPDKNLEVNLEMQDNDNTTLVRDSSGNGRNGYFKDQNGTLGGEYSFGTTSDLSYEDGPKGYLPRSLHIPARSNQYDPGEIAFGVSTPTKIDWADIPESQGMTIVGWGHMNGSRSSYGFFRRLANGNPLAGSVYSAGIGVGPNHDPYAQASVSTGAANVGSSVTYRTYSPPSLYHDPNTWFHHAFTIKDSNRTIFVDGEEVATTTSGYSMSYASDAGLYIGSKGRIAGAALFSRELSTDEISEAYSGPEPYAQVMPTISGTPAVGSFITINAGTWNSQSNGAIRYTYKMYSYSDTAGSDERLEKEITTFLTSQKILINNSSLSGRYLRFTISAENDGGTDPLEVYETSYTAAVTSGSEPAYVSYNALFGKGKHIYDSALLAYYRLNDNDNTDVVKDSSRNGWNGTLINLAGSAATQDISTSGIKSWDTKAMDFSSSNYGIDIVGLNHYLPSGSATILSRSQSDWHMSSRKIFSNSGNNGALGMSLGGYATGTGGSNFAFGVAETVSGPSAGVVSSYFTRPDTEWHDVAGVFRAGLSVEIWIDGSLDNSISTSLTSQANTTLAEASISFGGQHNIFNTTWAGSISDVAIFDRDLSSNEIPEYSSGPEPVNIIPPQITGDPYVGAMLSSASGIWDSQNNGSVSGTYQWYRADDENGTNLTAIAGATSESYSLAVEDRDKYITVEETAYNNGGYDELEITLSSYTVKIRQRGGLTLLGVG